MANKKSFESASLRSDRSESLLQQPTHSRPAVTVMAANPPDYRSRLSGIMRGLLTGPRGAATMQEAFQKLGPSIANLRPPVFRCGWPAPRSRVLALRMPLSALPAIIGLRTRPAARCADRAAVRCRGPPPAPKSRRSLRAARGPARRRAGRRLLPPGRELGRVAGAAPRLVRRFRV